LRLEKPAFELRHTVRDTFGMRAKKEREYEK